MTRTQHPNMHATCNMPARNMPARNMQHARTPHATCGGAREAGRCAPPLIPRLLRRNSWQLILFFTLDECRSVFSMITCSAPMPVLMMRLRVLIMRLGVLAVRGTDNAVRGTDNAALGPRAEPMRWCVTGVRRMLYAAPAEACARAHWRRNEVAGSKQERRAAGEPSSASCTPSWAPLIKFIAGG